MSDNISISKCKYSSKVEVLGVIIYTYLYIISALILLLKDKNNLYICM
jgi:hypothetical protein